MEEQSRKSSAWSLRYKWVLVPAHLGFCLGRPCWLDKDQCLVLLGGHNWSFFWRF